MKLFNKYMNYIQIGITIIALSGIFFPLINISIHLIGTANISFGLTDIFRNLGNDVSHESFDLTISDYLPPNINMDIILPFGAYILAIILTGITLFLTFTNKFKTLKIALVSTATTLMIYAGIRINALPKILIYYLEEILADHLDRFSGFSTSIVDFSHILEINLGSGYWITLSTLFLLIITKIIKPYTKEDQRPRSFF